MATRIFDFKPSDESALVEKVLVQIHKSVDQHLPLADSAPKRYSKTLFSEEESTALVKAAVDHERDLETKGGQQRNPPPATIPNTEGSSTKSGSSARNSSFPPPVLINQEPANPRASTGNIPIPKDSKNRDGQPPPHLSGVSDMRQFGTTFEYSEPRVPGGGKDLFMVILGLVVLAALAVGYWYLFESKK